jgi:hypothetical protein
MSDFVAFVIFPNLWMKLFLCRTILIHFLLQLRRLTSVLDDVSALKALKSYQNLNGFLNAYYEL